MIRKAYNYGVEIIYIQDSIQQTKRSIKKYIQSVMEAIGLRRNLDYQVSVNSLFINHVKNIAGRVMISLKETFPVFNFYWATPRRLVWF